MIQAAHLSLPKVGEVANGDRPILRTGDPSGVDLLGVIDALGHGPEADQVAKIAAEFFSEVPLDLSLYDMMRDLHTKLTGSRGAAGTVCMLRGLALEVCAVGNVELRTEARIPLVFSAGVLGGRVRKFHICTASLRSRTRLILFSDGISSRTRAEDFRMLTPLAACKAIMKTRKKEDDATVLVADVE